MPTTDTWRSWCLRRTIPLCRVRWPLTPHAHQAVERRLTQAQPQGHGRQVTSRLAICAIGNGQRFAAGAAVWRVPEQPVAAWGRGCWADGSNGAPRPQPTGRPPYRTPTPKAALAARMAEGPSTAGCRRAC